ncbi:MAG: GTP-binding protein [Candidatus Lokiarchaeota archaeon]|nr:GTP-binding protein [Candidatus Lokiarchaeota archaeon]MBD3202077.1 GTP-binding protein [Candidatus Lokiarchaeota archaeon]
MNTQFKIFLFGLDYAGKTTLSKFLRKGVLLDDPSPTKVFNIDSAEFRNVEFLIWDAPGQLSYREKWKRGALDANILLFLLDTSDKSRFEEAKRELLKVLNEYPTDNVPLVFCYHKMDLDKSVDNLNRAESFFDLETIENRKVYNLYTSIKNPEQMEFLKNLLVEMVLVKDWNMETN